MSFNLNTFPQLIPSFDEYKSILHTIACESRLMDYADITNKTREFIILRHDVEFSIERAWALSKIEHAAGISSSYFVQVTNNTYNILSKKSLDILRDMHLQGHHIGLHFHLNGISNLEKIKESIVRETKILSDMSGIKIDRYSFHRPTKDVLRANIGIKGLINAYDTKYFTFVEDIQPETILEVKYIADSMHQWNYGVPTADFFCQE